MALRSGYYGIKGFINAKILGNNAGKLASVAAGWDPLITKLTPSKIDLTFSENLNFETSGATHTIKKYGNICELYVQVKCLTGDNTWTQVNADVPKPYEGSVYTDIYPNGSSDTPMAVEISNSYGLRLYGGKANKYYNLHITYICKDGDNRTLSRDAAPEEIVKEEISEEPVVEKKTTTRKKSTAKAETSEEV